MRGSWQPAREIHHEDLGIFVGSCADIAVLRMVEGISGRDSAAADARERGNCRGSDAARGQSCVGSERDEQRGLERCAQVAGGGSLGSGDGASSAPSRNV